MAVLPEQARDRIWRWFMRQNTENCGFTKDQLKAAVDATDTWLDSNAAAFNTALPAAFRTSASLQQKTLLLCWVAMRRAGVLRVEEDG